MNKNVVILLAAGVLVAIALFLLIGKFLAPTLAPEIEVPAR